ncbi:glutamate racemase [Sulfobacillus acidophilus TPY]|uniref:Glutamate racemase n=1 Tax=Sulfobacillus acidophilus (strain ATCC 700253 / DSM 10332 / NAL) TaxID=679936 RepID=G8TTW3_SULAD|nr:glutamate racemase [Sulfobacillus acidophilus TPY]AEW04554.1 glutamate racemase [Sulfobacillus acidophilus DSM 10332]
MQHRGPIALFDSGEGGLTVLRHLWRQYPGEHFLYAADSLHFPYGPKPLNTVRTWFLAFLDFFLAEDARAIVIACNTATAAALDEARRRSPVPVIGVVEPACQRALQDSAQSRIGVLSTEGTYRSGLYPHLILGIKPDAHVVSRPCPVLVEMAENGQVDGEDVRFRVAECVEPVLATGVDTVILGCTHFPHMEQVFREVVGDRAVIIDPGMEVAEQLPQHVPDLRRDGSGHVTAFTTGNPRQFQDIAQLLVPELPLSVHTLQWDQEEWRLRHPSR